MKAFVTVLVAAMTHCATAAPGAAGVAIGVAAPAPASIPKPTPAQLAWQELDFGVMFHFDPRVYNRGGQNARSRTPRKDANGYAARFNPVKLDTDQWIAAAKALGANHAILVVKHEAGFCLWPSDANPYSVKSIPWRDGKADILKDFVASCRKLGLKPGIFTENRFDGRLGVDSFKVSPQSPVTQEEYDRSIERELEELVTRYGDLCEVWYDGGCGPMGARLAAIAGKHQPMMAFYSSPDPKVRTDYRWGGGSENGTVQYPCWATINRDQPLTDQLRLSGDPNGKDWLPARADVPLRCERGMHHWFYVPGGEKGVASLERLQRIYCGSVGRNAKTVIGFVPNLDGLIEAPDVARCWEFGAWLESTFGGRPLAETAGSGEELGLEIPADVATPVTHIVLQEDIKDGERVRDYVVEAHIDGAWKQIGSGSCIGHKRIEKIEPCAARKFRLRVTKSIAEPQIRAFTLR
jgi:alpha-L-fucosidase